MPWAVRLLWWTVSPVHARCLRQNLRVRAAVALQIPSDTVPFNEAPDMKAREICEAGKEALRSGGIPADPACPLLAHRACVVVCSRCASPLLH